MNKDGVAARKGDVFSDQYVVLHQICGDPEFYFFFNFVLPCIIV